LEQKFHEKVSDETLKPLLQVIQGLMRFIPSDRISASQALDLLKDKAKMGQKDERGMNDQG
jgi:serine/threonine-protein kinase SRPK3